MNRTVELRDLASEIRSKNAGPFWITLDVYFVQESSFAAVVNSGSVNRDAVAAAYRLDPADVAIFEISNLRTIKVSFPRPVSSGSFSDRDIHAGQQYLPLGRIPVEVE